MKTFKVEIHLGDDNKGHIQYETITDVSGDEASDFVDAWNDSGFKKPNGYNKLVLHSVTGGIFSISPLNVFGIKVTPMETDFPRKWQFKFTYTNGKESFWSDVRGQEIDWSEMSNSFPIKKVSFR